MILALGQKNPKFLHFLNPYTCPDLGQEESQKVWSTLVITLVMTLVPTVLKQKIEQLAKIEHFQGQFLMSTIKSIFTKTIAFCKYFKIHLKHFQSSRVWKKFETFLLA